MIKSTLRYRNVYGEPHKQRWDGTKAMTTGCDSNLIKGGSRYIAFSFFSSGGGRLAILSSKNTGKWQHDAKMLIGHNGPILDLDFFPYNDSYLATCSDDATIKIWNIPEDFTEDITACQSTLFGHSRKVNLIGFNSAAEGILASTSLDYTMKIWDVQKGDAKLSLSGPAEYCTGFEWGLNYDLIASTWRDKHMRISDVRTEKFQHTTPCHSEGGVNSKVCWLGEETLLTIGSSRNRDREYSLWDLRNLEKPTITQRIDSANGALYPFFDRDLGILYCAGKGDGNIKYYEYTDGELHNYANDYRTDKAGKGYGFIPKYTMNTKRNEIARFAKLGDNFVELISFICPRKAEFFQEDLFPDCAMGTNLSAEDWLKGKTAPPKRVSMRPSESEVLAPVSGGKIEFVQKERPNDGSPAKEESKSSQASSASHSSKQQITKLEETISDLKKENESLKSELESVRSASSSSQQPGDEQDKQKHQEYEETITHLQTDLQHQNENEIKLKETVDSLKVTISNMEGEIISLKTQLVTSQEDLENEKKKQHSEPSNSEAVNEEREKLETQIQELKNENENMINQRNSIQDFLLKHGAIVKEIIKLSNTAPEEGAHGEHLAQIKESTEQLKSVFVDLNLEEAIAE